MKIYEIDNKLEELTKRVRNGLKGNLSGQCREAATSLAELLEKHGYTGNMVCGMHPTQNAELIIKPTTDEPGFVSHFWIEMGSYILDPTCEQFDQSHKTLVFSKNNPRGKLYTSGEVTLRF